MGRLGTYLLALTLITLNDSMAQPVFERIFFSGGPGNIVELPNGNFLAGTAYSSSVNVTGVSRFDAYGNFMWSSSNAIDTLLGIQALKRVSNNKFYFVSGYYQDTCTTTDFGTITRIDPVFGSMDSLGNVSSMNYYRLNDWSCTNLASRIEIVGSNEAVVWGSGAMFFAMRLDSTGFPLWGRRFDILGGFQFLKELPGGDLLAGINMDTAGAVVGRMDAMGNFIWLKSYIRPSGMVHDAIIDSDSSFIITGYTDSLASTNAFDPLPVDYHPKLFMMQLNGSGDVQWCKGYDSAPNLWYTRRGLQMEQTLDGNYVVLANLGVQGYNQEYRPFLMKTDLNGDTLWTRSAGASGYRYSTSDLLAYSDGGFLFDGIIYGNLPQGWTGAPYIFKTDSLGHLLCNEQSHAVQTMDLFPTDSSFTLTSIDGATMHPAFVSDTVFDPITTYDACIVTEVPPSAERSPTKPRIRPNPNRGQFTVQFYDPLQVDSFYSVYDLAGKLLYQRPLPSGATTEDIDLSRFGKGTYLLKFTTPEEVWNERVVVE